MKILNFDIQISERSRRDWQHVKESAAEFIAELRRPADLILTIVTAIIVAAFMLLPWIAE